MDYNFLDFEGRNRRAELESKVGDTYSHFLINYLLTAKKEVVKITPLTLRINGLPSDLKDFFERQWATDFRYIELIEQKDKYLKLRLTDKAYLMAEDIEYERPIIRRSYLIRFFVWILSFIKEVKVFFLRSVPQFFKRLFSKRSGNFIVKAIGLLSTTAVLIWTCIKLYQWALGE